MRELALDGGAWQSERDFYDALVQVLDGPDWHGRNADAFIDTMIYNIDINGVQPPYEVVIRNAPQTLRSFLAEFAGWIAEGRQDRNEDPDWGDDVEVSVRLEDPD